MLLSRNLDDIDPTFCLEKMSKMSVENLIKPQNIPFPIGPATFKVSSSQHTLPGGIHT